MSYLVTRHFTSGILKGLTITTKTSVQFEKDKEYKGALDTSSYRVEEIKEEGK